MTEKLEIWGQPENIKKVLEHIIPNAIFEYRKPEYQGGAWGVTISHREKKELRLVMGDINYQLVEGGDYYWSRWIKQDNPLDKYADWCVEIDLDHLGVYHNYEYTQEEFEKITIKYDVTLIRVHWRQTSTLCTVICGIRKREPLGGFGETKEYCINRGKRYLGEQCIQTRNYRFAPH